MHREETRGKYSSSELEFLIKQKRAVMSCESRRQSAKFDVLSENRVQARLRGCDLPPTRGLFAVEPQTLRKYNPGQGQGCLSAYQANNLKGPSGTKDRLLPYETTA